MKKPKRTPEQAKAAMAETSRRYRKNHPDRMRRANRKRRDKVKLETLTHFSPNGVLSCSWSGCTVNDIDMLTLDHVNDDGKHERRKTGETSHNFYLRCLKEGLKRTDLQTLCANHQLKKEILRKRAASV